MAFLFEDFTPGHGLDASMPSWPSHSGSPKLDMPCILEHPLNFSHPESLKLDVPWVSKYPILGCSSSRVSITRCTLDANMQTYLIHLGSSNLGCTLDLHISFWPIGYPEVFALIFALHSGSPRLGYALDVKLSSYHTIIPGICGWTYPRWKVPLAI